MRDNLGSLSFCEPGLNTVRTMMRFTGHKADGGASASNGEGLANTQTCGMPVDDRETKSNLFWNT